MFAVETGLYKMNDTTARCLHALEDNGHTECPHHALNLPLCLLHSTRRKVNRKHGKSLIHVK